MTVHAADFLRRDQGWGKITRLCMSEFTCDASQDGYIFSKLFKDTDVKILHVNTMTLRFLVVDEFSEAQKGAVQNIDWLPAGVGLQYYHVITPTFGFKNSGLETFNNGTFATYEIVDL